MNNVNLENWYALFVTTGEEDNVKERLLYRFKDSFKVLVPKRKLKERKKGIWKSNIKVLFPGYVLMYGYLGVEEYYNLKKIPGLIKLIRTGYEPAEIKDYEMEVISKLIFNNEIIGESSVLIENGNIVVVDGPLTSLEGKIISINRRKGRAKVCLNFMGEERTIELPISVLESV